MDIFKFNETDVTKMEGGQIINGLKSKTWIERYRDMSEFTLIGNLSSGIRDALPIGSFISHVDAQELMIVENHQLSDKGDAEPEVVITGRSFESILEQRVARASLSYPSVYGIFDYVLASNYVEPQIAQLMTAFVTTSAFDPNDRIEWIDVQSLSAGTGVQEQRQIAIGNLYDRVLELLDINNAGLKTIRPHWLTYFGGSYKAETILGVHKGVDKSATVIFSYESGDIESADYLWSNKNYSDSAVITGRWVATLYAIPSWGSGYRRRLIHVDGSSIDSVYESSPTGVDLANVQSLMWALGRAHLSKKQPVAITNVEINKHYTQPKYRVDYDIGDLVGVRGNYDAYKKMRVIEHVEIEDENGNQSYPTLADPSSTT